MAGRIRSLKPELLDLEAAAALSSDAWRVWISMWTLADDLGNLRAAPKLLAGSIFHDTTKTGLVEAALVELAALPPEYRVKLYRAGGELFAHLCGWSPWSEAKPATTSPTTTAIGQYLKTPGLGRVPTPGTSGAEAVEAASMFSGTCAPIRGKSRKVSDSRRGSRRVSAGLGDPSQDSAYTHARADLRSPISDLDPEDDPSRGREAGVDVVGAEPPIPEPPPTAPSAVQGSPELPATVPRPRALAPVSENRPRPPRPRYEPPPLAPLAPPRLAVMPTPEARPSSTPSPAPEVVEGDVVGAVRAILASAAPPICHIADRSAERIASGLLGGQLRIEDVRAGVLAAGMKIAPKLAGLTAESPDADLEELHRYVAGCVGRQPQIRRSSPSSVAPVEATEAGKRLFERFRKAYEGRFGRAYDAAEDDAMHASAIAEVLGRRVDAEKARTGQDAKTLGRAMAATLFDVWFADAFGLRSGHAVRHLARLVREEPNRFRLGTATTPPEGAAGMAPELGAPLPAAPIGPIDRARVEATIATIGKAP